MESKKITYQIDVDQVAPRPGQYLVTLGKRGVLSVMVIKTVRVIKHRLVTSYQGYALELYVRSDLKAFTEYERKFNGAHVWVQGEEALACFWLPRGQNKLKRRR